MGLKAHDGTSHHGSHQPRPRHSQDDEIGKVMGLRAIRFELFILHNIRHQLKNGDTLVIIDFPQVRNRAPTDCFGIAWSSTYFRVSSEKLDSTGSAKFASLRRDFGTRALQKARKRDIAAEYLAGVKYIMDLTPDPEGDDIAYQMTELSLTPGIIDWWKAVEKHGVDDDTAGGHDDVCRCWATEERKVPVPRPDHDYQMTNTCCEDGGGGVVYVFTVKHKGLAAKLHDKRPPEIPATPAYRLIPDYCPVRHRLNIIRLLLLIEDKTRRVTIDSAPRLWTLVAVSKIFECPMVVLPLVRVWISARANSHFIEVLPEEALRLGITLTFTDVTKCAFRILVNEMALDLASKQRPVRAPSVTVFGRRRTDPGDDLANAIEYAARALVDRATKFLKNLRSDEVFLQFEVKEWSWLMSAKTLLLKNKPSSEEALEALTALEKAILGHWRNGVVAEALRLPAVNSNEASFDDDRALYVEDPGFPLFPAIFDSLNDVQKTLLSSFYKFLAKTWEQCPFLPDRIGLVSGGINFRKLAANFDSAFAAWRRNSNAELHDPVWRAVWDQQREFSMSRFDGQVTAALTPTVLTKWSHETIAPSLTITRHLLLNLTEAELKFLPLWAGGNDDGTGGVFQEDSIPPPAVMGPSGPGPGYHTGYSAASTSSTAASISSDLRALDLEGASVGPGSVEAQDSSGSTVYRKDRVVADDLSIHSEDFSEDSSVYRAAKFEVLAEEQGAAPERTGDDMSPTREGTDSREWEASDVCDWDSGSDETLSAFDWAEGAERNTDLTMGEESPAGTGHAVTDTKGKAVEMVDESENSDEDLIML